MKWNLLMLDDEVPVIQALKILINREKYSIGEVFEATNGRDGLTIMKEHPIHLVLLDMHMPMMDGPAFLKEALVQFPYTKYIVISNYSDFKYTKQSIEAKAVDYILKPIDADELNLALDKAVEVLRIEQSRRREEKSMRKVATEVKTLMRRRVYESYIKGHINDFFVQEYEKLLVLEKRPSQNAVFILKVLNFKDVCQTMFQADYSIFHYAFINVIEEKLEPFGCVCISSDSSEDSFIGIVGSQESDINNNGNLERQLTLCLTILENIFGAQAVIAVGDIVDASHLSDSYESAKYMLQRSGQDNKNIYLPESFQQDKMNLLYDMRSYLQENYNQPLHLEDLARRYYMTKEHLTRLFKQSFGSTPYEFLILCRMEKALDLLADSNRSVVSIAEKLGYSNVNYFSKAFRKYYGSSPTQYRAERGMKIDQ